MIVCVIMLHLAGVQVHVFETRVNTTQECRDLTQAFAGMGFGVAMFTDSRAATLDKRRSQGLQRRPNP